MHTKKRRKIVQPWKRRPGFCLYLSNNSNGITADVCWLWVTVFKVEKEQKGQTQFTYHLFSWITGIKTNVLLIFFWGLIANLALFCDGCDVGNRDVNNFDWNNVGISLLTGFLKLTVFKTAACFYISFVVPLTNWQLCISDWVRSSNWRIYG
jgi:hypothetical protein